jgi:hypothetical protein
MRKGDFLSLTVFNSFLFTKRKKLWYSKREEKKKELKGSI